MTLFLIGFVIGLFAGAEIWCKPVRDRTKAALKELLKKKPKTTEPK